MNIKHIIYLLSMFPCFRFNLEYFEQSYSDLPTPNHIRYCRGIYQEPRVKASTDREWEGKRACGIMGNPQY